MVYPSGQVFSLTGDVGQGPQPFALPPTAIDTHFTEPFACQPASFQTNVMSDCYWTQIVFGFDIYNLSGLSPPTNLVSGQLSFGVTNWPVAPVLQESNYLVFQPTQPNDTLNNPVNTFQGVPLMVSDIMAGTYEFEVLVLEGYYELMLKQGANPVWIQTIPFAGVPKILTAPVLVGPTGGDAAQFSAGEFTSNIYGFQTHDSGGNLIEPYPFKVLQGADVDFTYASGVVVQYANETGESANLTQSWTGTTSNIVVTTSVV
jgi:hypothetical protein